MTQGTEVRAPAVTDQSAGSGRALLGYLRRNPNLLIGIGLLLVIVLFVVIGSIKTKPEDAKPLSFRPSQPPSAWVKTYPL